MKPALSLVWTPSLPMALGELDAGVEGLVGGGDARTTSTSFMTCAGLK